MRWSTSVFLVTIGLAVEGIRQSWSQRRMLSGGELMMLALVGIGMLGAATVMALGREL